MQQLSAGARATPRQERAEPSSEGLSILYLAGASRTGSTIMANLLGQLDGYFAVGELWNLWRRGLLERRRCGCGEVVPECPVWREVLLRVFSAPVPADEAHRLDALARHRLKTRRLGTVLAGYGRPPEEDGDDYRQVLLRLYRAISEVTGCRVIVDSSKGPEYALLLGSLPDVDVSIVNVVRDPRAVAFSAQRTVPLREFDGKRLMQQAPAWVSARRWLKAQLVTGTVVRSRQSRFVCVRYEDFSRDPRALMADLVRLMGATSSLPFLDDHSARLEPTHSVAGNPARFRTGTIPIRVDEEWRTAMPVRDRAVVSALTLPFLLYHGYPVHPGRGDEAARGAG